MPMGPAASRRGPRASPRARPRTLAHAHTRNAHPATMQCTPQTTPSTHGVDITQKRHKTGTRPLRHLRHTGETPLTRYMPEQPDTESTRTDHGAQSPPRREHGKHSTPVDNTPTPFSHSHSHPSRTLLAPFTHPSNNLNLTPATPVEDLSLAYAAYARRHSRAKSG